jgi:hypothetical protein
LRHLCAQVVAHAGRQVGEHRGRAASGASQELEDAAEPHDPQNAF